MTKLLVSLNALVGIAGIATRYLSTAEVVQIAREVYEVPDGDPLVEISKLTRKERSILVRKNAVSVAARHRRTHNPRAPAFRRQIVAATRPDDPRATRLLAIQVERDQRQGRRSE